jgi:hypothetical protein
MNEEHLPGKPLIKWAPLFSDSAFDQLVLEEKVLFQPGYLKPLRLALWLDYFLMAGQDRLKEKWAQLSWEEQQALGIELLRCYLFQPLFLRLSQEERSATKNLLLISGKPGNLLRVEVESETTSESRFFYPLAHQRLWPGFLAVFEEGLFSSKEVFKGLQPELTLASSSRLETIRHRAETLDSFFLKWQGGGVSPDVIKTEQTNLEKSAPVPMEDLPAQTPGGVHSASAVEAIQSAEEGADLLPTSPTSPPKKKKRKTPTDQLKLF